MTEKAGPIRVLAVVAAEMQEEIRRRLLSFGMNPVVISSATELSRVVRDGEAYHVVLLPTVLPDTNDWWAIWGELSLLNPKPAILVYAKSASFRLWSSVLEAGGYDVIVGPLTDERLKEAVLRAAASYGSSPAEGPVSEE